MGITEDMKKVTEDLVSSYQSKISTVGMIIDDTYKLLEDFKTKRNEMSNQLKETLAKEESLRKTDFDNMTRDILSHQEEREKQVKALLRTFFEEQKEIAEIIQTSLAEGEKIKINDFKKLLQDIQARQRVRENEVCTILKEFQTEYKEMAKSLRSLLNKGEAIRIKDFKETIKNIRTRQAEREEEVRKKLAEFRREQHDMASEWHKITEAIAKERAEALEGGEEKEKEKVSRV